MDDYESLSHTKWDCKYHVVFIPKYRRKVLYGELRQYLGEVFRKLALQKESRIEQGHLMPDHVHMMLSIPPKYAVSPDQRQIPWPSPDAFKGSDGGIGVPRGGRSRSGEGWGCALALRRSQTGSWRPLWR